MRRSLALLAALALLGLAPAATARPATPVPTRTVAELDGVQFLESVAVDRDGALYVTSSFTGQIVRITPDGARSTYAQFPADPFDPADPFGGATFVGTVAFAPGGVLYATYINTDQPDLTGLYRVTADGQEKVASFPPDAQPNGITADRDGLVYAADSARGRVYRIDPATGTTETWIEDASLAPTGVAQFPGANGVRRYGRSFYVSNSSTGEIIRVPVRRDGSAGTPRVHATGVPIDDFAVDVAGRIYGTTHPFDTVVRVDRDGSHTVLAGVDQGVIGPTAAAFGTVGADRFGLYVVTDGGFFGNLLDPAAPEGPPSVVRLQLDAPGLPLPGTTRVRW